jgi:formylglycine-generating enzyme required for sulfatase activity
MQDSANLTNSVGMKLVPVRAGTFRMGSPADEAHHSADEGPPHMVRIKRPFYLGAYPVTRREFLAVLGYEPRGPSGGLAHPVCGVSWEEAWAFCRALSRQPAERHTGRVYELPCEAEWEYACRAGTTTPFAFGEFLSADLANCNGTRRRTTRVGNFPPNAWDLFDMHGNVWEWCDGYYYDEEHYRTAPRREEDDRPGGKPADPRVVRGGCWKSPAWRCRSADRYRCTPGAGYGAVGFRVLCRLQAARRNGNA